MHADDPPQRRPSAALDRPSRTPFGPRRPKHNPDMYSDLPPSPADSLSVSHADAAVQAAQQKPPPPTFVAPPPLTPPPAIAFDSTSIPWKGLPLEAAQWTFSSAELQEIVSKAIRLSARDSFVRLLSLQTLEVDIIQESERLEAERLAAQARWRFEVGRRTMLMQALNACAAFSSQSGSEDGPHSILGFVGQLASAVASCDSLFSTILSIADQQSQITVVQHQHWASALGIALRKLNRAHERQGQELKRAQARVQTLEDELEEAWHEARKMAIEFDDLEDEIAESETSELPQDIVDPHPDPSPSYDLDETGTLGDVTIHTDIAVVLGVTATAVASKATLFASPAPTPAPGPVDISDTKSIRSVKSVRSFKSTRSRRDGQTHLARLTSARMRSRTASNASLRLPRALRSAPSTHTSPADPPPIPALPSNAQCDSFLDLDNVSSENIRKVLPKRHPEPTVALPTPPHSAGLPLTHVPSIWLESDSDKPMNVNGLDRSRSLSLFPSLAPRKMRRSDLVMSLTGSDRSSDHDSGSPVRSDPGSRLGSAGSSVENQLGLDNVFGMGTRTRTETPTSNHSPVSLPTHALSDVRGPLVSPPRSTGHGVDGSGAGPSVSAATTRPGSAGARLTTTREDKVGTSSVRSPRRSLVSRASSVILRRLSQATIGSAKTGGASGKSVTGSPAKSRWKDRGRDGEADRMGNGVGERGGEGEVLLIGSPHADVFDAP